MNEFKQYKRRGLSEMRPYVKGEDLSGISVSPEDNPETDMGMISETQPESTILRTGCIIFSCGGKRICAS